jgi:hypothetical protein
MIFGNNGTKYKLVEGLLICDSIYKTCPFSKIDRAHCNSACAHMHIFADGSHKFASLTCANTEVKIKLQEVRHD